MMFEGEFNLKFNLVKAYIDIGLSDDNAELMAMIYGLSPEEYSAAISGFEQSNRKNAAEVLAAHGAFHPDPDTPCKIAYLGDSITSDRESHQHIVREILKDCKNIVFKDFSVSGYKASDLFTQYYPDIADFSADIAVIMIGTNDMRITDDEYRFNHGGLSEYSRNIDYLTAKLTASGTKVIICTLPPFDMSKLDIALEGWKVLYTEESRGQYDEAIVSAAKAHGAILVDMREIYKDNASEDLTIEDGLHLNGKGQTLLAGQIFQRIAELIEEKK